MTEVSEAHALILGHMPRWPRQCVPLADAAGRVLAEPVVAERDQPPFDRVTMDGIAIAFDAWRGGARRFRIVGTQAAGAEAMALARADDCVRVMTGAMCPDGADTIVPVERLTIDGEFAEVQSASIEAAQFIHPRGSDRRAGAPLLAPGTLIGPAEAAILASAGCARPAVAATPRIAVISTGDELVGLEEPVEPYQIRSSNDFAIAASLARHRLASVSRERLADDESALLERIGALHDAHDVLILSGGVSMGDFDFVPAVLEHLGARIVFHRVEQRPGRPLCFGISAASKPIFALPGNPVSTLVCLTRYVLPALRYAAGLPEAPSERVALAEPVRGPSGMTYFLPVKLAWSDAAVATGKPFPTNTSGDFISLAGTDGFLELPPAADHAAGTVAPLFRW